MRGTIVSRDDLLREYLEKRNGKVNLKFNRVETSVNNFYFNFSDKPEEETIDVDGILKCYLGHSRKFSNVVPQFLFVKDKKGKYSSYLPIFGFTPSQMIFADHDSYLSQGFDLAGGYCGSYKTSKNNHIKKLKDNSHLYKVCITVPKFYKSFLIKNVIWKNKIPYIGLYHHTTPEVKPLILNGGSYLGSKWNIQGSKKLLNSERSYFTVLDSIETEGDLSQIAMRDVGDIILTLDGYTVPEHIDKTSIPPYIKIVDVYRSSTSDRTSRILQFIDTSMLKPQFLEFHKTNNDPAYYKLSHPFIHSVPMIIGKTLAIRKSKNMLLIDRDINLDNLFLDNYAICSDCTQINDIDSAYNEECPGFYYIIEDSILDPISFWKANTNSDQFTGRVATFEDT